MFAYGAALLTCQVLPDPHRALRTPGLLWAPLFPTGLWVPTLRATTSCPCHSWHSKLRWGLSSQQALGNVVMGAIRPLLATERALVAENIPRLASHPQTPELLGLPSRRPT